mmetsp:Transcript_90762/g.252477  ORF Transcript_90762/g.252477 Transcript_90762/m.252477 type:complete len:266 (+) Transcript_90762:3548-4345(+)
MQAAASPSRRLSRSVGSSASLPESAKSTAEVCSSSRWPAGGSPCWRNCVLTGLCPMSGGHPGKAAADCDPDCNPWEPTNCEGSWWLDMTVSQPFADGCTPPLLGASLETSDSVGLEISTSGGEPRCKAFSESACAPRALSEDLPACIGGGVLESLLFPDARHGVGTSPATSSAVEVWRCACDVGHTNPVDCPCVGCVIGDKTANNAVGGFELARPRLTAGGACRGEELQCNSCKCFPIPFDHDGDPIRSGEDADSGGSRFSTGSS